MDTYENDHALCCRTIVLDSPLQLTLCNRIAIGRAAESPRTVGLMISKN